MANYVTNTLEMEGIASMPLYGTIKFGDYDGKFFDLNKIVPMPKRLDVGNFNFASARIADALAASGVCSSNFDGLGKAGCVHKVREIVGDAALGVDDTHVRRAIRYLDNIRRYGYMSWYQWRGIHWGVRKNTMDLKIIDDDTIEFVTCWTPPIDALRELSRQHRGVEMALRYADESDNFSGEWGVDEDGNEWGQ